MAENSNTLWVTGYHPHTGQRVSITFVLDANDPIASANAWLARLGELHIAVNPPAGDAKTEEITRIVRRQFRRKDGKPAEVVDFYAENLEYKLFTLYVDTDADAAKIEAGTGVKIATLKAYQSTSAMGRDQDPQFEYMTRIAPALARMLPNPEYNPDGKSAIERGAQRVFSEWLNAPKATTPAAAVTGSSTPPEPQQTDLFGVDAEVGKAIQAGLPVDKWSAETFRYVTGLCNTKGLDVRKVLKLEDGQTGGDYNGTLADAIAAWAAYGAQGAA